MSKSKVDAPRPLGRQNCPWDGGSLTAPMKEMTPTLLPPQRAACSVQVLPGHLCAAWWLRGSGDSADQFWLLLL